MKNEEKLIEFDHFIKKVIDLLPENPNNYYIMKIIINYNMDSIITIIDKSSFTNSWIKIKNEYLETIERYLIKEKYEYQVIDLHKVSNKKTLNILKLLINNSEGYYESKITNLDIKSIPKNIVITKDNDFIFNKKYKNLHL